MVNFFWISEIFTNQKWSFFNPNPPLPQSFPYSPAPPTILVIFDFNIRPRHKRRHSIKRLNNNITFLTSRIYDRMTHFNFHIRIFTSYLYFSLKKYFLYLFKQISKLICFFQPQIIAYFCRIYWFFFQEIYGDVFCFSGQIEKKLTFFFRNKVWLRTSAKRTKVCSTFHFKIILRITS